MRKIREEDILVNPDQIPQGKEVSVVVASAIVENVHDKQKENLKKQDLSRMDWHKQTTI